MTLKTIFSDVESWFKKLWAKAPAVEQTAYTTLSVAAPLLETAVALTAGEPAAALVTAVVSEVQNDLAVAAQLVKTVGNTPQLTGVLNAILSNLNPLTGALEIKNATNATKFQAIVTTVIGEVKAIIAAFTPSAAAAVQK